MYIWDRCTQAWPNGLCNSRGKQKFLTLWSPDVWQYTCSLSGKVLHNGAGFFSSPEPPSEYLAKYLLIHNRPFPWTLLSLHWAPVRSAWHQKVDSICAPSQRSQPESYPGNFSIVAGKGTAGHLSRAKHLTGMHKTRQYKALDQCFPNISTSACWPEDSSSVAMRWVAWGAGSNLLARANHSPLFLTL